MSKKKKTFLTFIYPSQTMYTSAFGEEMLIFTTKTETKNRDHYAQDETPCKLQIYTILSRCKT